MTTHELWSAIAGLAAAIPGIAVDPADPDAAAPWPDIPLPWLAAAAGVILALALVRFYPAWRERRRVAAARRTLAELAKTDSAFAWPALERRIRAAATALHAGWNTGDLGAAAGLLTEDLRHALQAAWSPPDRAVVPLLRLRRVAPILLAPAAEGPARLVVLLHLHKGDGDDAPPLAQARQLWTWVLLDGRWYLDEVAAVSSLRDVVRRWSARAEDGLAPVPLAANG